MEPSRIFVASYHHIAAIAGTYRSDLRVVVRAEILKIEKSGTTFSKFAKFVRFEATATAEKITAREEHSTGDRWNVNQAQGYDNNRA